MSDAVATGDTTETRLLGGRLTVRQPRNGHRVGSDAMLLAAAVAPRAGELVMDCGSGVGGVGLAIAIRDPDVLVHLVEIVPELADLAEGNARRNGLGDRVTVARDDLLGPGAGTHARRADWLASNPPFHRHGDTRASPDAWRARAHRLPEGIGHGDWLRAMLRRGRADCRVAILHRPDALPELLVAAEGRLGNLRVLPIHPREGSSASRILFGGIVGSRAPLALRPPLMLHASGGDFTPRTDAIHRGQEHLPLLEA